MEQKKDKVIPFQTRRRDRRAVMIFLAAFSVLLLIVAFFAVNGGKNWDAVRRFFMYGDEELIITRSGTKSAAVLDGNIVTAGTDGITLYDRDGKAVFVAAAALDAPALQTAGASILAYDAGGGQLVLLSAQGEVLLQPEDLGDIYDADLSQGGSLAVVNAGTREKSVLRVYDSQQILCFSHYSDTRYFVRCAISPKGDVLCAVALGQQEGVFTATAVFFRTDREEPVAEIPLGSQMIYDMRFWGQDTVCLVGEKSALTVNSSGELLGSYEFDEVTDYSLEGDNFCALVLTGQGGDRIVTLDRKCRVLGENVLSPKGGSVSASGQYVAWLSDGAILMSDSRLKSRYVQRGAKNAQQVCAGAMGIAYCFDSQSMTRYLP